MEILYETMRMPENYIGIIACLILIGIACLSGIIFGICELQDKDIATGITFLLVCTIVLILVGIGIINLANTREHVIKIVSRDNLPLNAILEQYKIDDIEGKIITLIEK